MVRSCICTKPCCRHLKFHPLKGLGSLSILSCRLPSTPTPHTHPHSNGHWTISTMTKFRWTPCNDSKLLGRCASAALDTENAEAQQLTIVSFCQIAAGGRFSIGNYHYHPQGCWGSRTSPAGMQESGAPGCLNSAPVFCGQQSQAASRWAPARLRNQEEEDCFQDLNG